MMSAFLEIIQYTAVGSAIVQCIGYTFYSDGDIKPPMFILNIIVVPSLISIVVLASICGGNNG